MKHLSCIIFAINSEQEIWKILTSNPLSKVLLEKLCGVSVQYDHPQQSHCVSLGIVHIP